LKCSYPCGLKFDGSFISHVGFAAPRSCCVGHSSCFRFKLRKFVMKGALNGAGDYRFQIIPHARGKLLLKMRYNCTGSFTRRHCASE
jgi:hypothetical protein